MERTPWFSVAADPVRIGWYEVKFNSFADGLVDRVYWRGRNDWRGGRTGWGRGFKSDYTPFVELRDEWRGLTAPFNG